MTSSPPARPRHGGAWTIEDLFELPDDGKRYEILDGSLLVSPPPDNLHGYATQELTDVLRRQAPADLYVAGVGLGVTIRGGRTFFIPDVIVLRRSVFASRILAVNPGDVPLVVEVLSPSNARHDLVTKRRDYAAAGIPFYWIVNREERTLTVLRLDSTGERYVEAAVVRPGEPWKTDEPFPLTVDLAEIFSGSSS